ncbi:MAG TPA: hypothetical protein VN802_11170 [Stellaceae bacterium]|nr:hypothetical protein [Stellaceae bacterium]
MMRIRAMTPRKGALAALCCALAASHAAAQDHGPTAYVDLAQNTVAYGAWSAAAAGPAVYVPLLPQQAQAPDAETQAPEERRIPGQPPPPVAPPPLGNPNAVPPPQPIETDTFIPVPDRWRILDALGRTENMFDPYNTNTLKGDKLIFGNDWFFNFNLISDTLYQPSRVPVPVGPQSVARPGSNNTFGRYGRSLVSETDILSLALFQGDTAFKPPYLEFRATPVFNFNHVNVGEVGLINVDPRKGQSRDDNFVGLQEAFVDYHIRNVSERYDFDSVRVGIQPFSTDFRGFLFQDNQLGVRFFGNRDNNRWQYNLAYFRRFDKDTNSGLNDVASQLRKDDVFVANVYRQDLPVPGFTSQLSYVRNTNHEAGEFHYDTNGFIVRPAQIGDGRGYNYDVNYLGYNGDGHFGRINLTTSAYWAIGHQDHNQFSGLPKSGQTISSFFFAAEPSIDFDWVRLRLSGLYASGDNNPQGGRATGFDAIFENPQFAGADTSYWIRQGIPFIGGGGVSLTQPNGVLADLRSSKDEGQSNFTNPGLELLGIGSDFDILPELRFSTNANYLRFVTTAPIEFLRNQGNIPNTIGYDLSLAFTYRPLDSQNVVLRLSGAALLPGAGLKSIYNTQGGDRLFSGGNFLYSVLANMILTY